MHILFVEDNEGLAEPLLELFRREGYSIYWANELDKAYDYLAEREPDLMILDVMLPESENAGFDFAKNVREAEYKGRILFLSARDDVADRVMGLDLGGDDYLVKPFSLVELLARVRPYCAEMQIPNRLILLEVIYR
ncbi:MAG: response regulator [Deinococcales bacterium]